MCHCSLVDIIEVTKMIDGKDDVVGIFKNLAGYTDWKNINNFIRLLR